MGEFEMMQRIDALEKEVKALRGQKYDSMKQTAVDAICQKYPNLDDSFDMVFESACLHVQVEESDTQFDVNRKIEDEVRAICKKYKMEEPCNSREVFNKYIEKVKKQEEDNQRYAEELKQSFV